MTELCLGPTAPLRPGFAGLNTGLIQNGHDALVIEAPIYKAEYVMGELETSMRRRYPNLPVTFTASAKCGMRWSEV
jgi:DNA polymerase I-like protein with 3'-5' exonuclease and polymerase domains